MGEGAVLPCEPMTTIKFACTFFTVLEFVLVSFALVQKESSLSFLEWVPWYYLSHVFLICQPYAKRSRVEFPMEEEYRSALQAASGALEAVELLLQKSPAPDWLLMKMEMLQERIDKLKRRVL